MVTWLSVRFAWVNRIVKSELTLLCYRGQMLRQAMKRERTPPDEIMEAVRRQGLGSLTDVEAVVLESGATLTVIRHSPGQTHSILDNVSRVPGDAEIPSPHDPDVKHSPH